MSASRLIPGSSPETRKRVEAIRGARRANDIATLEAFLAEGSLDKVQAAVKSGFDALGRALGEFRGQAVKDGNDAAIAAVDVAKADVRMAYDAMNDASW